MNTEKILITKADLAAMSNAELLNMVKKSKGHTGKDFKSYMKADFSYTALTNEITRRGGKTGYYFGSPLGDFKPEEKKCEAIKIVKSADNIVKKNYRIDKHTSELWDETFKNIPSKSFLVNMALLNLIEKYKNHEISFYY